MATHAKRKRLPRILTPTYQQRTPRPWRIVHDRDGQLRAARIYLGLDPCGISEADV